MYEGTINGRILTEDEKLLFIAGWESVGGYMGDKEASCPWCAPWCVSGDVSCAGKDAFAWGISHWEASQAEIERLLAEEELLTMF